MATMNEASHAETHTTSNPSTTRTRKPRVARKASQAPLVGSAPATAIAAKEPGLFGRVAIYDVTPSAGANGVAPRVSLGEPFAVGATVTMEPGRTAGATAVLKTSRGRVMARVPMTLTDADNARFTALLKAGDSSDVAPWDEGFADVAKQLGTWKVAIEGWQDSYVDWYRKATQRLAAGLDVDTALAEGAALLTRWAAARDTGFDADTKRMLRETAKEMGDETIPAADRVAIAHTDEIVALHAASPLRDGVTASQDRVFHVERPQAAASAWYLCSPRSEGATRDPQTGETVPGTLRSAMGALERVKDEGFGIVALLPVFPLGAQDGTTASPADLSRPTDRPAPIAVGNEHGGFDAVDPQLGTMDDFRAYCMRAHELGLEVALDLTLACAPTNPWVAEHPAWFPHRADGTPAVDGTVVPLDFDNALDEIERETERVLEQWVDAGVTAFRVGTCDAPARFWQDVIAAVTKKHPAVLFLSDTFTTTAETRALAYAGFTQTRSGFPWQTIKPQIDTLLADANGDAAYWQRDAFWPATPDMLTDYLRDNGTAGHAVRAVLAALGSPNWGIPAGYELVEDARRTDGSMDRPAGPLAVTVRDWERTDDYGIAQLVTSLNRVRAGHPATRSYHDLTVLPSANPAIVAFARYVPADLTGTGKPDMLIVVVNLDCTGEQQSSIHVDLDAFGLPTDGTYKVHDELTGREFDWSWDNFVALAPWADVAHVLSVEF